MNEPNYKRIYTDILKKKFPEKITVCSSILAKEKLSVLDVIKLNNMMFGCEMDSENQKHRAYDVNTIYEILDYQKKHHLNNVQLSLHFKLSRNTVAKWKKIFY